jgi:arylformamidase
MIYDISQPLGVRTAVWPGDQAVELAWALERRRGDTVNVATLRMSAHTGTHADGPMHFRDGSSAIGSVRLDAYVGPALVIDARGDDTLGPELLDGVDLAATPRVLFRTRESVDPEVFPDTVVPVSVELAVRLGEAKGVLLGTDAPSVDPIDSRALDAHRALARGGIAILENLVLTVVPPRPP